MILEHNTYTNTDINEQKSKLINLIKNNWNDKLSERLISPRILYNLTLTELKKLYNTIDENNTEVQTDDTTIQTNNDETILSDNPFLIDKKAVDTLEELKSKHLSNEAVQDIRFDFDDDGFFIVFDVICETDIQSVLKYNNYRLKYNRICEIPQNDIQNSTEIDDTNVDKTINEIPDKIDNTNNIQQDNDTITVENNFNEYDEELFNTLIQEQINYTFEKKK